MNVAGIPDAKDPHAFWEVMGLCAVIAFGQLALFKRLKWF
jgi:Mg2+ and Co2+ transporter CorA